MGQKLMELRDAHYRKAAQNRYATFVSDLQAKNGLRGSPSKGTVDSWFRAKPKGIDDCYLRLAAQVLLSDDKTWVDLYIACGGEQPTQTWLSEYSIAYKEELLDWLAKRDPVTPPTKSEPSAPESKRRWFQILRSTDLDAEARAPKRVFVARAPSWSDVVHGTDHELKFIEREATQSLVTTVRTALSRLGRDRHMPVILVLGSPGAGKTTLVRRTASILGMGDEVVIAALKPNHGRVMANAKPLLDELDRHASEAGQTPLLLVLDDPLSADSGWLEFFADLSATSANIAVIAATPDFLYEQNRERLACLPIEAVAFELGNPTSSERRALAAQFGCDPMSLDPSEGLLALAMNAYQGADFRSIIERIWQTLNDGLPIPPNATPAQLSWIVRAYLIVCWFGRFGLGCPASLLKLALSEHSSEPAPDLAYFLRRLVDQNGWRIFDTLDWELVGIGDDPAEVSIHAAHMRIARAAWDARPVKAFDLGEWMAPLWAKVVDGSWARHALTLQAETLAKLGDFSFSERLKRVMSDEVS